MIIDSWKSIRISSAMALAFSSLFLASAPSHGQEHDQRTAPWDYRDPTYASDLATVERNHFNMDVQMLRAGQSTAYVGYDLAFILRYFPNHPGALNAMSRLWRSSEKRATSVPPGMKPAENAEFYFEKALNFAPDDGVVHMLYGMHLFLRGRNESALPHVEKALVLEPDSAEINYNAGLYFFEVGDYDKAMRLAKIAYDKGYPLPGLRSKLTRVGAWRYDDDQ